MDAGFPTALSVLQWVPSRLWHDSDNAQLKFEISAHAHFVWCAYMHFLIFSGIISLFARDTNVWPTCETRLQWLCACSFSPMHQYLFPHIIWYYIPAGRERIIFITHWLKQLARDRNVWPTCEHTCNNSVHAPLVQRACTHSLISSGIISPLTRDTHVWPTCEHACSARCVKKESTWTGPAERRA
jgi:hypothetical protein